MSKNFKYLDELVHSGKKEIVLDSDIILEDSEESEYLYGIKLDLDDIVIDGNGHAIDACEKTRIFSIKGKNIIIQKITLKNGFSQLAGGAIFNDCHLTIKDSTLTKNKAKNGGAIYNSGDLTIKDSTLTKNMGEDGGAIYNDEKNSLTIINSTLNENIAEEDGGAIRNNHSKLSIRRSTMNNNTAERDGGAICHSFSYSLTKVRRGLNSVQLRHSPDLYERAELNARFSERRLMEEELKNCWLNIEESTFNNNTAQNNGGGIWHNNEDSLTLNNCNFNDNTPDDVY